MPVEALLLDFNGTISDDEELLYEIYATMFAARGRPLTRDVYIAQLAGRSDADLFHAWLGGDAHIADLTAERIERYVTAALEAGTITDTVRQAVILAATRVKVGIVTSAWRDEVVPILRAAGLEGAVSTYVCADDVVELKPSPEPYLLACRRLGVPATRAFAVEDTEAGIASAQAAGIRCAAVTTTMPAERLRAAERLLPGLDRAAVDLLLRS